MKSRADGSTPQRWLVPRQARTLAVAALVGTTVYACVDAEFTSNQPAASSTSATSAPSSGTSVNGFDRNALLRSLSDEVIVPTYAEFVTATAELTDRVQAYAATLSPSDRTEAQSAWRRAMDVWQRAELLQLGPAAPMGNAAGGMDLRDEIYSWPLVNRCATDNVVASRGYLEASFPSQLVNVRGLDAMEYLLFETGPQNACPPQVPINADGTWAAITDLDQRRADYAAAAATLVAEGAQRLQDSWSAAGGNFARELGEAGRGATAYESAQLALNAVSDALFYIEATSKDVKLAVPTGLSPDCSADRCPKALELRFSGHSKEAIRQNLIGFRVAFMGGDAIGFDDWLTAVGAGDVTDAIIAMLNAADAAVDAIEESSLQAALDADPESVETLYFALKDVSDKLKSDFITVLDLELPQDVQGDND